MKFSKISLAIAALTLGSSAFAAPNVANIAISSGASATKGNLLIALRSLCTGNAPAGNAVVLTEFAPAGNGNISTYVCGPSTLIAGNTGATSYGQEPANRFKNFTGTSFSELRLNVTGGSFTAVCLLNRISPTAWPAGACQGVNTGGAADTYFEPTSSSLTAFPTGSVVVGGLLDVEAEAWPFTVTAGLSLPASTPSGVSQTFGVAVSSTLYTAMFNDQRNPAAGGGATSARPIPNSCAVTDTAKAECVPVIGKAQVSTILFENTFGSLTERGANFLAPSLPVGTTLTYARRNDTSGTQAAAQAYFQGTNCNLNPLAVVPPGTFGSLVVLNLGSTGNVRSQLSAAGNSIGIMSGENNQAGSTWRWLRLGGVNMADSAAPNESGVTYTNAATAVNGRYDYWFESKVAASSAVGADTFWTAVTGALVAVAPGTTPGLFASTETTYTKSGNACQPPVSN